MFGYDLFRISAILDDCLCKIKDLKGLSVRFQKYEYCAKLRDIEKQLEAISGHLSPVTYAIPNKGLTQKGRLFYNELFNYGICTNWKPLPENIQNLLSERKIQLNEQIRFDDNCADILLKLSKILVKENDRIHEFYSFLKYVVSIKGLDGCLDDLQATNFTMKCFTQSKDYEFIPGSFNHDLPFYQLQFSLDEVIRELADICDEDIAVPDYLKSLPVKFRDEKFCRLFTILATNGILAWTDFLNIDQIKIELNIGYHFYSESAIT